MGQAHAKSRVSVTEVLMAECIAEPTDKMSQNLFFLKKNLGHPDFCSFCADRHSNLSSSHFDLV